MQFICSVYEITTKGLTFTYTDRQRLVNSKITYNGSLKAGVGASQ